jgi:hypothetical protein
MLHCADLWTSSQCFRGSMLPNVRTVYQPEWPNIPQHTNLQHNCENLQYLTHTYIWNGTVIYSHKRMKFTSMCYVTRRANQWLIKYDRTKHMRKVRADSLGRCLKFHNAQLHFTGINTPILRQNKVTYRVYHYHITNFTYILYLKAAAFQRNCNIFSHEYEPI